MLISSSTEIRPMEDREFRFLRHSSNEDDSLNFNKLTGPAVCAWKHTVRYIMVCHFKPLSLAGLLGFTFLDFPISNLQLQKETAVTHLAILLRFHICLSQQRILKWKCRQTDTHWMLHNELTSQRLNDEAAQKVNINPGTWFVFLGSDHSAWGSWGLWCKGRWSESSLEPCWHHWWSGEQSQHSNAPPGGCVSWGNSVLLPRDLSPVWKRVIWREKKRTELPVFIPALNDFYPIH